MPDETGRLVKADMLGALEPAELDICGFVPPTAPPPPPPPDPTIPIMIAAYAHKSAQARTDGLFDFLVALIAQGANDEIARQNLIQLVQQLRTDMDALTARVAALE